jgi:hypothetical protein
MCTTTPTATSTWQKIQRDTASPHTRSLDSQDIAGSGKATSVSTSPTRRPRGKCHRAKRRGSPSGSVLKGSRGVPPRLVRPLKWIARPVGLMLASFATDGLVILSATDDLHGARRCPFTDAEWLDGTVSGACPRGPAAVNCVGDAHLARRIPLRWFAPSPVGSDRSCFQQQGGT